MKTLSKEECLNRVDAFEDTDDLCDGAESALACAINNPRAYYYLKELIDHARGQHRLISQLAHHVREDTAGTKVGHVAG